MTLKCRMKKLVESLMLWRKNKRGTDFNFKANGLSQANECIVYRGGDVLIILIVLNKELDE